jgi:hypothetical protein
VQPLRPENDSCRAAKDIIPGTSPIAGSTVLAQLDGFNQTIQQCSVEGKDSPALWYRVLGTGGVMTADTCATTSDMKTAIAVYGENACEAKGSVCITSDNRNSFTSTQCPRSKHLVVWKSQKDVVYHIRAGGYFVGEFNLTVAAVDPTLVPDNNSCGTAKNIVASNTLLIAGNTLFATPVDSKYSSLWYRVLGTGGMMTAKTRATRKDIYIYIAVYGVGHVCGTTTSGSARSIIDDLDYYSYLEEKVITWQSQKDVVYHIEVNDDDYEPAMFELEVY